MKKVLFSVAILMLSCCIAMAQTDPKALKQAQKDVKAAQRLVSTQGADLNEAQKLVDGVMQYDEIKAQPDVWNVAGNIQRKHFEAEMQKLYLKQAVDYNKMYNSLYEAYQNFFKCDNVEKTAVDKKGRPIKVKYHDANRKFLLESRPWLINGGVKYYNEDKNNQEALKYFSLYIESAENPMLKGDSTVVNDTLVSQIAYYASLASMQLKDPNSVLKYTPLVKTDKSVSRYGYEFSASAYRELGDTAKWIAELQEGVKKFPDHNYFFGNLLDYYNTSGKYKEALEFADAMVQRSPEDAHMQYVKGYLCQNLQKYEDAINAYKAAINLKPDYAEACSNLGLIYCQQANDLSANMTSSFGSAQYKKDQETLKGFYREAKPYYEKARELRPDKKEMWLNGLYTIYYMLNMGPELKEIEKMMEN